MSSDFKTSLGSDNHSGVHPEIFEALHKVNQSHAPAYGTDPFSKRIQSTFRALFGENSQSFFVFNGTAANVLCLKSMIKSHHSVFCSDVSHLNLDECGAPENTIGCKLTPLKSHSGKISAAQIEAELIRLGDQHFSQAKAISITQPTELGTVYSLEELSELVSLAKKHKLLLHCDGARLIYAANYLKCDFKTLLKGFDAASFGGTKNGLLMGEAVVLLNPELQPDFKFIRKQCMQLPSKMRFIAAQFEAFLATTAEEQPLWQRIAEHGHKMAKRLEAKVKDLPGVEITQSVQANAVFAKIPKAWTKALREQFFFYVWDEKTWEMRWMASYDINENDIDQFASAIERMNELSPAPGVSDEKN